MTIEVASEDLSGSEHRELRRAELVALGLLAVQGLVIVGHVAAAISNQVQYGGPNLSVEGGHAWGYTLTLASGWSNPAAVAVFLLAPLALVAWIGRREGDELSHDRSRSVLRLELVLALLTVAGGILAIVGRVMQFPPSQQWSAFFVTLGIGVGSVALGLLAIAVVRWLADDLQVELFTGEDVDVGDPAEEDRDR